MEAINTNINKEELIKEVVCYFFDDKLRGKRGDAMPNQPALCSRKLEPPLQFV